MTFVWIVVFVVSLGFLLIAKFARMELRGAGIAVGCLAVLSAIMIPISWWGPSWQATAKAEQQAAQAVLPATQVPAAPGVVEDPEYPSSGREFLDFNSELHVWLDTKRSDTDFTGPAKVRYTFVERPSLTFDDPGDEKLSRADIKRWRGFPSGKYTVTLVEGSDVYFRWCMCQLR